MRTGKIDVMDGLSLQTVQSMKKTNPEILPITIPASGNGTTIDPRNDKAPFSDIRVREALQMAIDLPTIASSYYGGVCSPDPSSLTSNYMAGWGFPYAQWPQDVKDQYAYNPTAAKQLLAAAGYPNGFNTDCVVDTASDLDLLQMVKSYFAAIGVNMDIRPMDSASFTAFVRIGHKQDALAQSASGQNALTYAPFIQFVRYQPGNLANYMMINDPVFNAFYTSAMAATSTDEVKQIVIDANKYVAQQHFVISLLQPTLYSLYQPWLEGYSSQYGAVSGSSGPELLFFYAARFWINQSLKTSLGH